MRAMFALVEARQRLARDARQYAIERLQQHHLLARLGKHRRRFQPDVAATDHHRAFDRGQLGHHAVGIGARADGMDAGEIVPRARQSPRAAAGGPDQFAIADRVARAGRYRLRRRVDADDPRAQPRLDRAFAPEGGGADQQPLERLLARQIFLGERRALVGQIGLVPDHQHRARELQLPQHHRRLRAAMARPHDHHIKSCHVTPQRLVCASSTVMHVPVTKSEAGSVR